MKSKMWRFFLTIVSVLLLIQVNNHQIVGINSNIQEKEINSFKRTMQGYVIGDFGENGSCSMGFIGGCREKWNTTVPVPFEYEHYLHDETVNRTTYHRLSLVVKLYNPSEELAYKGQKVVYSGKNLGYEFLDSFAQTTSWDLSEEITGIPAVTTWEGILYMNATLAYGGKKYSNTSNSKKITYQRFTTTTTTPSNIILEMLCATLVTTLIKKKKKKSR